MTIILKMNLNNKKNPKPLLLSLLEIEKRLEGKLFKNL